VQRQYGSHSRDRRRDRQRASILVEQAVKRMALYVCGQGAQFKHIGCPVPID
jgi:hypothetical protein